MLVFPNCKINLGLAITGKRADGFHNIETVFYPIPLKDALEIIEDAGDEQPGNGVFSHSGTPVEGEEKDNLCIKAYQLLKKDLPQLPDVKIHLHKAIPMGAGLGGGSADAVFTLLALNEMYLLQLSEAQLIAYALELGSDCPFFILNRACLATGRGEVMEPVNLTLTGFQLLLVNPGIHINTRWAFSQLKNVPDHVGSGILKRNQLKELIAKPLHKWKGCLVNDFEMPIFKKYASISMLKNLMYDKGALYASMSGSGSTVFGIFENHLQPSFSFPENYITRTILL